MSFHHKVKRVLIRQALKGGSLPSPVFPCMQGLMPPSCLFFSLSLLTKAALGLVTFRGTASQGRLHSRERERTAWEENRAEAKRKRQAGRETETKR